MKPDRWRKVDELFEAALEREPASRAAFLDQACGSDRDLRREVEKMLELRRARHRTSSKQMSSNVAAKLITQPRENRRPSA